MAVKDDFRAACAAADLGRARELFATGEVSAKDLEDAFLLFRVMPRKPVMEWLLTLNPSASSLEQLMYRDVHRADGGKYDWLDEWFATHRMLMESGVQPREATTGALLVLAYETDELEFADWLLGRGISLAHARVLAEQTGANFAVEALEKIPPRTDDERQALLAAALSNEDAARVARALEFGANPDRIYPEGSPDHALPLADAARSQSRECVDLLLRAGADVNARNGVALSIAAEFGSHEVMAALLAAGADVNANDGAALFGAAGQGDIEAMRMLVDAGANLALTGQRALDEAVDAKQKAAADWLRARLVQ